MSCSEFVGKVSECLVDGSAGAQGSNKVNKNVIKSKRRRFQGDDDNAGLSQVDSDLKELLAKELSDYLDRTIEEVEICERDDEKSNMKKEEEANDFQLFSNSQKMASEAFSDEIQNCHQEDTKASLSSGDEDDDETSSRLKEAAISVQDIFGSKFNHHQNCVKP